MLLVLIIAKFLIMAILGLYVIRILQLSRRNLSGVFSFARRKEISVVIWVFILAFGALLGYQAYWQLFIHNQDFMETLKLHDPRPWIIEATTQKGTIYDRHHDDATFLAGYAQKAANEQSRRYYPLGDATSHIIGYSDVERGKAGLEKIFFNELMGRTQNTPEEKENYINNKFFRIKPVGNDITLTLDYDLQKTAYEAFGDKRGAVVAIEPSTGDVLVMVSAPSYHPDSVSVDAAWVRIIKDSEGKRLYNRALKGRYPPGSTFKPIVASAALDNGIDPIYTIGANGYLPPGVHRKRVYDHERAAYRKRGRIWHGQGTIDMTRALVKSSNAYFARLGVTTGDSIMHAIAYNFGYNQPFHWNTSHPALQKELVVFRSSFPPTKNAHELAWSCIGQQEVLATPIELAMTAAAIANDGVLMRPKLELNQKPEIWHHVISPETAKRVRMMMREVVWARGGTAWRMRMKKLEAGGKTGTAELTKIITHKDGTRERTIVNNAVFISFAPVENPKIAIAVIAEEAGYGGSAAAPIAKEVYKKALELGYFNTDGKTSKDIP